MNDSGRQHLLVGAAADKGLAVTQESKTGCRGHAQLWQQTQAIDDDTR